MIKLEDIEIIGEPITVKNRDVNWVFCYQKKLYRLIINSESQERWSNTQEFVKGPEFKEIVDKGCFPHYELTGLKVEGYESGDVYFIKDNVYCLAEDYKTLGQKLDCIKLVCKIHKILENSNFILVDPHYSQLGFNFSDPMYIDIGSFSPRNDRMFEIAIKHFTDFMLKDFELTFKGEWKKLIDEVDAVKIDIEKKFWSDYVDGSNPNEKKIVNDWLSTKTDIETIIDVGCNQGGFAKFFNNKGYKVVALDNDEFALNELYNNSKGKNIFCAKVDVLTPLESDIWWQNWTEIVKSDLVFCSSITHHLYKAGMDFYKQVELWNKIGQKYAIIEVIDKRDSFVGQWNLDSNCSLEGFFKTMSNDWKLIDIKPSETVGRQWVFMERRVKNG